MEHARDLRRERGALEKVVRRAQYDEAFLDRLKEDPVGVLAESRVSRLLIGDFLRESGYAERAAVSPFLTGRQSLAIESAAACDGCCISCVFTSTCNFTVGHTMEGGGEVE
jgi:hypothetical protein